MGDTTDSQILLDGEGITEVPRSLIRQKLSCLTQDPSLLGETIKFNAGPLQESSDEDIIKSLERIGLWELIGAKIDAGKDPLCERMDENFLSRGQRQLFCLAKARLKKTSVLILDEPKSRYEAHNYACLCVQLTCLQCRQRSDFKGTTISMIAHRISTLLDFDQVAVLQNGRLAETGSLANLLANTSGAFTRLYRADQRKGGQPDSP